MSDKKIFRHPSSIGGGNVHPQTIVRLPDWFPANALNPRFSGIGRDGLEKPLRLQSYWRSAQKKQPFTHRISLGVDRHIRHTGPGAPTLGSHPEPGQRSPPAIDDVEAVASGGGREGDVRPRVVEGPHHLRRGATTPEPREGVADGRGQGGDFQHMGIWESVGNIA